MHAGHGMHVLNGHDDIAQEAREFARTGLDHIRRVIPAIETFLRYCRLRQDSNMRL
jgi:hypothetical protein